MKPLTQAVGRLTRRRGAAHREQAVDAPDRPTESWRPRAALAAVVVLCLIVTGVAVAGAGNASPGLKFVQSGHWIYNSTLGTLFHVDGGTKNVDGQVPLPGAGPGTQVVQTDKSGYVLAQGRTIEFGKSDLTVADPLEVPVAEVPVGLEAAGVAYAVYRQAGRIARFGENSVVESVGGHLGPPVVTSSGTLWVHRQDTGQLCQLPVQADRLSCPAKVSIGHTGALSMVGDKAVFVDTTARLMLSVDGDGIGRTVQLDQLDLGADSIVAPNDVAGRVAIVDPKKNVLHLVGTGELTGEGSATEPVSKKLRPGKYGRVASSGSGLAMIDETSDTLVTLDRDGNQRALHKIPPPSKQAKVRKEDRAGLFRGADSRLYVDSRAGEHVMVVDEGGDVTPVDTGRSKPAGPKAPKKKPAELPKTPPATKPKTPPSTRPVTPRTTPPVTPPASRPTRKPTRRPTVEPSVEPPEPQREPTRKPRDKSADRPPESDRRPTARPTREPAPTKPTRSTPPEPEPTKPPAPPPPPKPTVRAGKPGGPAGVMAKAGDRSATVTWRAAASNGATISRYTVSWSGGSRNLSGSARKATMTGLTNGRSYAFTVRAVNRVGTGPGVSSSSVIPGGLSDAPRALRVKSSDGQLVLTWQQPDLNGGKLLGYQARLDGDSRKNTAGTSATWTGLTNGKRYQLEVQAVTQDADGTLKVGRTATTSAVAGGRSGASPTLTASRGEDTTYGGGERACEAPDCAFIEFRGSGFAPNTKYKFVPWTSEWGAFNPGVELTTDSRGRIAVDDRFPCSAVGQEVWVVMSKDGETVTQTAKLEWT